MKNLTAILVVIFFPYLQLLSAQCFDLDIDLLQGCPSDPVELNVTISGGEAPYVITWTSNVETGNGTVPEQDGVYTIEVLESPSYNISVTDNTGCTETIVGELVNTAGAILIIEPLELSCAGDLGTLIYTVNYEPGFAYPVTIELEDIVGNEVFNGNLSADSYCVIVRDANNCTAATECIEITEPQAINLSISITNETCISNGEIILTTTGGTPDYIYDWSDLAGNNDPQNRSGMSAGTYSVTVSDANGCFLELHDILVDSDCNCDDLQIESIIVTDASCGESNGSIAINVFGNEEDFIYNWSPSVSTNNEVSGLASGAYQVTISDVTGNCFLIETIIVNNQDQVSVVIEFISPATCLLNNGSAELSPASLLYSWADGGTGPIRTDLSPGVYQVTATNGAGCESILEIVIDMENLLVGTANIDVEPSCNESNGEVTIVVTGGSGDYSYDPSGPVITDLASGTYLVIVTDNLTGCVKEVVFTLGNNIGGEAVLTIEPLELACAEDLGTLVYTVDYAPDFVFPSTILIQGISGNEVLNGFLSAGYYCMLVIDGNGCLAEMECIEITEPSALESYVSITDQTCTTDGSITVTSSGGTFPYVYALNGGPFSDQTLYENLGAGMYTITTMDANNCTTETAVIIEPSITLDISSTFANCDSTGGTATVSIIGGASDPVFTWSNGQIGAELINVAPGWYSVTVTDNATNCVSHQNVEVLWNPNCFVHISGYVFNDSENEDCITDASSSGEQYILVELSNGAMTFTDADGYYEFETIPGTYEVFVNLANAYVNDLCVDPIMVDVPNFGDAISDNNFWVNYSGIQDLYVYVSYGAVRPGFTQKVIVYAYNYGGYPMNGTVSFKHDDLQVFHAATPAENSYDENSATLSWDFEDLAPGASVAFVVDLSLPVGVDLGTPIFYRAVVNPLDTDANPENNVREIDLVVTGSFDPNDKQVTPRGEGEAGHITREDSLLTYQVRFQNTGTDTAFTVVILDKIEEDLDVSTVRPGASSHPYELNILEGNILEFRFENIMLPDSFVNEEASNGYVLFDIKTKRDLPFGTSFENTAEIYFDFNEPIVTNTTINTLTNPVSLFEVSPSIIQTQINPNPGGDESVLIYTLDQTSTINLDIYDINGKLLSHFIKSTKKVIGTHQISLDKANLPKGVYLIYLETDQGLSSVQKWIKMK